MDIPMLLAPTFICILQVRKQQHLDETQRDGFHMIYLGYVETINPRLPLLHVYSPRLLPTETPHETC